MADRDVKVNLLMTASGDAAKQLKAMGGDAAVAARETAKLSAEAKAIHPAKVDALAKAHRDAAAAAKGATVEVKALNAEAAKTRSGVGAGTAVGLGGGIPGKLPAPGAEQAKQAAAGPAAAGPVGFFDQIKDFAAMLGTVTAGIKALAMGLTFAAKSIDALGDSSLSSGQKMRKIGEAIPVLGEVFVSINALADAITGKTESIRKSGRDEAFKTAEVTAKIQQYQQSAPVQTEIDALKARSQSIKNRPGLEFKPPARDGSAQGDVAFSEYERGFGLEQDKRKAAINVDVAADAQKRAAEARQRLEKELADAEKQTAAADAAFEEAKKEKKPPPKEPGTGIWDAFKSGIDQSGDWLSNTNKIFTSSADSSEVDKAKIDAGHQVKQALLEEQKIRQQLIIATQKEGQTAKEAAQAESEARKAVIAVQKQELEFLKEKEQRIKGSSGAFGALSALDKQAALESAQALKEKGYDALTPEAKSALSAAGFGNVLNAEAIKSAQASPDYQKISQLLGQDFDLAATQKAQVNLQADIQATLNVDEAKLADTLADKVSAILEKIVKQFEKVADAQLKQIKIGQEVANAAQ